MVKTADEVRAKMTERVQSAGKYLKAGMDAAEDPISVLLKNPEEASKKHMAGIVEANRKGSYIAGLKKAQANDSWIKSKDRAGAHFEERAGDMVANAMKDYDKRASAIEAAQKVVASMPTTTRAQRIAKAAAYANAAGTEFDKVYGRKA